MTTILTKSPFLILTAVFLAILLAGAGCLEVSKIGSEPEGEPASDLNVDIEFSDAEAADAEETADAAEEPDDSAADESEAEEPADEAVSEPEAAAKPSYEEADNTGNGGPIDKSLYETGEDVSGYEPDLANPM